MDFAKKHSAIIAGLIIVIFASFQVGYKKGEDAALVLASQNSLKNTDEGAPEAVDFSPFWKAWSIINKDFVPTASTTKIASDQDRVWGAIKGMVSSLEDPYTVFFPPVESKSFASDIKGSFGGVGMEVGQEGGVTTIIAPLKGSPAEKAGLRAGDRILKVNDKEVATLSTEEAVSLIRGPEGTSVTITVARQGKTAPITVNIIRQIINIPIIDVGSLGDGIYKISLFSFTENSAPLFRSALRSFVESGDNKLIVDLRGNPGGYLESAIDMASWFLPSGTPIVREDKSQDKEENVYRSRGYDVFTDSLQMVILVDGGSASASEILAGALSEHGKAVLIGEKTFGKGSVQELVPVTDDTSLKVTIARWLTPKGNSISQTGIAPDIEVAFTDEDRKAGKDVQLERALQYLKTGK